MTTKTAPLRTALAETIPDRPFRVELWDGTALPSTNGNGPAFRLRSPAALAHLLRAPSELGVGRAYVTGALQHRLDVMLEISLLEVGVGIEEFQGHGQDATASGSSFLNRAFGC